MAHYHPSDELLMAFAAGQQVNALGIMLACHLESCSQCRAKVAIYEKLGGDLIDTLENTDLSDQALPCLLSKLDTPYVESSAPKYEGDTRVPNPLRRYLTKHYSDLEWKGLSSSIKEYVLPISDHQYTAKFYKIAAGKELPEHTHRGNEFTLVMEGSFSDKAGAYNEGDFILADTQTIHQPKASMEADCICFAVMDAPLKMTGFFGRMLNPFMA